MPLTGSLTNRIKEIYAANASKSKDKKRKKSQILAIAYSSMRKK